MARVSFTLRRIDADTDLGSYLRFDTSESYDTSGASGASFTLAARTDIDTALRSDGLQTAPETFAETYFEAVSSCYGEVDLEWAVNIVEVPPVTPDVTGIVLVYSPLGEPQTIAAGDILVESSTTYTYSHSGLTEGRWAYYSLFLHYESSGGDSYYERAASLAVLVPANLGSTSLLWNRIPEYYRAADTALGDSSYSACVGLPAGQSVGPLYKFLSIIGFDMDRMRTMLDYQMVSNDPALANTEHLDALGLQLGTILESTDLGAQRLRTLLNDIGFFRRSKGTEAGTKFFGSVISGSLFDIDQTTGEITVYSQRVNYITVPKNGIGITTDRAAFDTEETTPNAFGWTGASVGAGSYAVSGNTYSTTGTGSGLGINSVMLHNSSPVPVLLDDRVWFSVQSNVGTSAIKWARLVDASGNVLGFQDTPVNINGSPAFEIVVDDEVNTSTTVWTTAYVEYFVKLGGTGGVSPMDNGSLLAERNHLGTYFDGDTVRGGWLIDSSSVSDYRWSGSANSSASIFAEDYERTKKIINQLLWDVVPITEESKYTIVAYNAIPGF